MKLLTFSLLSIILISCGNTGTEMDSVYVENAMEDFKVPTTHQPVPPQLANQNEISKKVIKTGKINFQSENVAKDYHRIKTLVSTYDSYIDYENETNSNYQINYDISIRVASESYDSLYYKLSQLSDKVDFKSSNIEDVTERYYDLKTRIKNKKLLEDKYLELLKRATTIKDILEIERSINNIRNEIESAEGSFRYLSKQISYSTIQLNFYEILPYGNKPDSFWSRVSSAVDRGWQGFLTFLVGVTQLWPFIIVLALGFYLFKKVRAYRIKKK